MTTKTKLADVASIIDARPTTLAKFRALNDALNAAFPERQHVITPMLAALVAGQHVLLLGRPGVAKSALANALSAAMTATCFEYLMTRTTEPAEVFGSPDIKVLSETGRLKLVTHGRLTEAHVGFLDEVFKSNSVVLNSLLTLINERKFHDDGAWMQAPLQFVIAASNEVPSEDDNSVTAFFDRFLVRLLVAPLEEDANFERMVLRQLPSVPQGMLTIGDVETARDEASQVDISAPAMTAIKGIRRVLNAKGIAVSDRRWGHAVAFLRALAWLSGESIATTTQVAMLKHVCWSQTSEINAIESIISNHMPAWENEIRSSTSILTEQRVALRAADGMAKGAAMERLGEVQETIETQISVLEKLANETPEAGPNARALIEKFEQVHTESIQVSLTIQTKKKGGA